MHENVSERKCWRIAIEDELKMMMDKEVWSIVKKPENARMFGMKWENDGIHRARLVAMGFQKI